MPEPSQPLANVFGIHACRATHSVEVFVVKQELFGLIFSGFCVERDFSAGSLCRRLHGLTVIGNEGRVRQYRGSVNMCVARF